MAKRAKPAKPAKSVDPRSTLMRAVFERAMRDGWRGLRIAEVARAAGMTTAEAYKVAPDRAALLDAYVSDVDGKALDELTPEPGAVWRDTAFEALMTRFETMLKDRDALRVIYFDDRTDVLALARSAQRTLRSIERVLEASSFATDGVSLRLGAVAFVPLYARVFRTWLNDESDLAKTMSELDKALLRLDSAKQRFGGRARSADDADATDEEPAEPTRTNGSTH